MARGRRRGGALTPLTLADKYSGSEILPATAGNFPALNNFWDKNHVSGYVLADQVGTQDITSSTDEWGVDEFGFYKFTTTTVQQAAGNYEAPGDRDFMLIGCGQLRDGLRTITIGGNYIEPDLETMPGMSINPKAGGVYPAFLDVDNHSDSIDFSFGAAISNSNRVTGCFATVISPTAGTCKSYWAGRTADDPAFEAVTHTITGSIATTWGELGQGWTMNDRCRLEWAALMMFESGAPLDMQEAMTWMAQYDDVRLYPGWALRK